MQSETKPKKTRAKKEKPAEVIADRFVNKHDATVEVRAIYDGAFAKPGHVWYVWSFKFHQRTVGKGGKVKVFKRRKQGGLMIEKTFEAEHGENNVKRMIIQNIVNKQEAK